LRIHTDIHATLKDVAIDIIYTNILSNAGIVNKEVNANIFVVTPAPVAGGKIKQRHDITIAPTTHPVSNEGYARLYLKCIPYSEGSEIPPKRPANNAP
jgi:hypothetical protein